MKLDFKNKKVFLTGASGGIGKNLAEKFISNGAKLILTSSNEKNLNALKDIYGENHLYYLLDLSDSDKLNDNVKKIKEENNDIDILINNAGIAKDNLLLRMNKDQWQDVIDINLTSNFYIIKNILPDMIKSRKGKILGITSVVAFSGILGKQIILLQKAV